MSHVRIYIESIDMLEVYVFSSYVSVRGVEGDGWGLGIELIQVMVYEI